MLQIAAVLLSAGLIYAQSWTPQPSGVDVPLRGVAAVNARVAWASGADGKILRTTDGGETWASVGPEGVADLDFRDLEAIDEQTAFAMSAGAGGLSRLYKTLNGGRSWFLAKVNLDPAGFWDAIGFWDEAHGILVGDPVDGRFTILTTGNEGSSWEQVEGPKAEDGEVLFAASGTCLFVKGTREAWFATGGPKGGRVFHSEDGGETWSVDKSPLRQDSGSAGIFSLAFLPLRGNQFGIAVGGDYMQPEAPGHNVALTENGGRDWRVPAGPGPAGYRSAVAYVPEADGEGLGMWVAVGTSGSDVSRDDGATWEPFDNAAYNAVSFARDGSGWAVGPEGAIARFTP